jgi:hypothetical protein
MRTIASRLSQGRTDRRNVPVLSITRSEARKLHFPVGHPLDDVVYVGNPGVPSDYFTLADFHPTDLRPQGQRVDRARLGIGRSQ